MLIIQKCVLYLAYKSGAFDFMWVTVTMHSFLYRVCGGNHSLWSTLYVNSLFSPYWFDGWICFTLIQVFHPKWTVLFMKYDNEYFKSAYQLQQPLAYMLMYHNNINPTTGTFTQWDSEVHLLITPACCYLWMQELLFPSLGNILHWVIAAVTWQIIWIWVWYFSHMSTCCATMKAVWVDHPPWYTAQYLPLSPSISPSCFLPCSVLICPPQKKLTGWCVLALALWPSFTVWLNVLGCTNKRTQTHTHAQRDEHGQRQRSPLLLKQRMELC